MSKYKKLPAILTLSFIVLALIFVIQNDYAGQFTDSVKNAAKIPDNAWDKKYQNIPIKNKYKVALVVNNGGEYSYGKYFKFAAERIGWEVNLYNEKLEGDVLSFDPDFIMFFREASANIDMEILAHRSKKYLVLFSSLSTFKDHCQVVSMFHPYMPKDDFGRLLSLSHAVLTSAKDLDMYRVMFDSMQKPFNGIRMLSLVPTMDNIPAEPNNLMWIGTGWDNFRQSASFKEFISLLSQNTQMKVYGRHNNLTFLAPKAYDGYIAPGMDNVEAIRKNGIYLLTNSEWHFEGGEPGMRIFEAVAANAVVISDKHPFAIDNFGDNLLYFDQEADSETMYKQVKAHYDWIKANPEKAKAMAARAHQIFLEKFTLEKDLVRIAKMHEYIVKQEKEMELSYPLAY